jgi:hypothetical protein
MSCVPHSGVADTKDTLKELSQKLLSQPPQQVLADAINRTGDSDDILARRTRGEVAADRIARFRGGVEPIPPWKEISKLLSRCVLSPSDIGQRLGDD